MVFVWIILGFVPFSPSCRSEPAPEPADWRSALAEALPRLGHRNWILIADAAYPSQTRPGIRTTVTNEDHVEAVRTALEAVADAPHVRAIAFLDEELAYVTEDAAPGIDSLRRKLLDSLEGIPVESRPHEELIEALDDAAETFEILVLKTKLLLPYTSVFLRLECGYWDAAEEESLRRAIKNRLRP
jgi:hypothetical protein